MEQNDEVAIDAVCKELGKDSNTRITVILPTGLVVGDTEANPKDMDNHKGRPEIRVAAAGGVGRSIRRSPTLDEERMYIAIPIRRGSAIVAVVRTSIPITAINATVRGVHEKIALAGLAVTGLLMVVSLWLSARISRPLQAMSAGAERFAREEFGHRLSTAGFEEMNILARAMNRMAEQLEQRIRTVKRQQNELEAMLGSMAEGVLAVDRERVIINVNRACTTLLGVEPGELKGQRVHEVVRKPDVLEFVETALASHSSVEGDILVRGPEDRWLQVHGTALHDAQHQRIGGAPCAARCHPAQAVGACP